MKLKALALMIMAANSAMASDSLDALYQYTEFTNHDPAFSATAEEPIKIHHEYRYSFWEDKFNERGNKPYYERDVSSAYDYMVYNNKNIVKKLGDQSVISDINHYGTYAIDSNPYHGYEVWTFKDDDNSLDTSKQEVNSIWFLSKSKEFKSNGYKIDLSITERGDYGVRLYQTQWGLGLGLKVCINDICERAILHTGFHQVTATKTMIQLKDVKPSDNVRLDVTRLPYVRNNSEHHFLNGLVVFKEQ